MRPEASAKPAEDPGRRAYLRSLFALTARLELDTAAAFSGFPEQLPFRLGESRAEASVPVAVSDALADRCADAVNDLLELLRSRHETRVPESTRVAFEAPRVTSRRAPAPSFLRRTLPPGPGAGVVLLAPLLDPGLDTAFVDAWMRGAGGAFAELVTRVFTQAVEEDINGRGETRFAYLASLALLGLAEDKKTLAKSVNLRGVPWERLEKTVGLALYALCDASAGAAMAQLGTRRFPFDLTLALALSRAALSPLAFVGVRTRALQNDLNPWALPADFATAVEPTFSELLAENPSPTTLEARLGAAIGGNRSLRELAVPVAHGIELRRRTFQVLARFDGRDSELVSALHAAVRSDASLRELADPRELASRATKLKRAFPIDAQEEAALDALVEAARPPKEEQATQVAARAFAGWALDVLTVKQVDRARARVRDRRREQGFAELRADWDAGRLYRIAGDGHPILRPLRRNAEGHLFIDLKGYTQRTHRSKELVMAEFLREEFYKPIVGAAATLLQAGFGPAGNDRLRLQNLLGDAALFSGEVPLLVALARNIQLICAGYGSKLAERSPGVRPEDIAERKYSAAAMADDLVSRLKLERSLLETELQRKRALRPNRKDELLLELFTRRREELTNRKNELEELVRSDADPARRAGAEAEARRQAAALETLDKHQRELWARLEPMDPAAREATVTDWIVAAEQRRVQDIDREIAERQRHLESELRSLEEELRAATGYGLESGTFITYGASAETIRISDPAYGEVRVAIAEKLNEAARGTSRNSQIKAKLEAYLEHARAERKNPRLEYPFLVHVDSAYQLVLPPGLGAQVGAALRARDGSSAADLGRQLAEGLARDLARGPGSSGELLSVVNDIYNLGEALSGEALDAYLRETLTARYHFRRSIAAEALHPALREGFVYLEPQLELVISLPHGPSLTDVMIFRLAGQVHFRGFEAKQATTVYELVRPDSAFQQLFVEHHLAAWAKEVRENPSLMVTGLT